MNENMIKKLGTFNTESDELRITDPCYEKTVWCCGTLKNCNIGEWTSFIKYNEGDNRVAEIITTFVNDSVDILDTIEESKWIDSGIDVGVDSGQCGIFDDSKYPKTKEELGEWGDESSFYGKCCDLTDTYEKGGLLDFGAVSSSGYGDGSYTCLYAEKNDKISTIRIIFIPDDEDEDEEY